MEKRLREYYDKLALEYDTYYQNPHIEYMRKIEQKLLLKHLSKGTTLDIGCGTGEQSIFLAKQGFNVVGLDISLQMVKIAQSKARLNDLKIDFLVCDAISLPFKKQSFDNIISLFGALNHVREYYKSFKEMRRVLRKSGNVLISVANYWNLLWWLKNIFKLNFRRIRAALKKQEGKLSIRCKNSMTIPIWTHFFSAKEVNKIFKKVSFFSPKFSSIFILFQLKFGKKGNMSFHTRILIEIEEILRDIFPFNRLGGYVFIYSKK